MVKHVVPYLKKQKSGSIIQFGSISGCIAQSAFVPYAACKGAVIQMSRNLALDLGPFNIRCNSVSPGCICTCLFYQISEIRQSLYRFFLVTGPIRQLMASRNLTEEQFTELHGARQCLKRLGAPQEIANLVVFLASDLCPFLTGANLLADGGYTTI